MRTNPWIISADGHNGDIDFAVASQFCKVIRHCGITAENDAAPVSLEQITVITAISIPPFSRAPVVHSESSNIDLAGSSLKTPGFAPAEFGDVTKACSSQ